jgi:hypothetical protein
MIIMINIYDMLFITYDENLEREREREREGVFGKVCYGSLQTHCK